MVQTTQTIFLPSQTLQYRGIVAVFVFLPHDIHSDITFFDSSVPWKRVHSD